jgi:shikimate dehydrogenase
VQATSVGLDGSGTVLDRSACEKAAAGGVKALLDLVYAPQETALVKLARGAGLRAEDGLGVLVHQAAEAYELMWGRAPGPRVMLEAARQAAGRP